MVTAFAAELAAMAAFILVAAGELWHLRRIRRAAPLAFGPVGKPVVWARFAPLLRAVSVPALAWGLITLLMLPAKTHRAQAVPEGDGRHLVLVLDVSPSMRLQDAGPTQKQSRSQRASQVLDSFFQRVPIELYKVSVVATYTGAKPVVIDTSDLEVIRNILNDLPMNYAFKPGPTDLFAGLEEAAKLARPWPPGSTTLMLVSDGDTVPATGMPKMPASIAHILVVGVGDPKVGRFIEGHQSRQDVSTLRQIAIRLGGAYHNGNELHLASSLLHEISKSRGRSVFERLTRREYAMLACGFGASILALLPWCLHRWGCRWRPGPASSQA